MEFFIFMLGALTGSLATWALARVIRMTNGYSGTIVVNRDKLTEKTVYSLELDEFPETLAFKKVVIFRVENPE